ncbi:MAG: ABC transporter ATP-binding protein [Agathobacter sp.]|nr:ABC transporter ATP-binding protein [Agathobacter sp.]
MSELLKVKNLTVHIETELGTVEAVRDVSLTLHEGEILAIVGESGCGKSMLCRSVMKLLPEKAQIKSGSICAAGTDITACPEREMARLRGSLFSIILQNPMSALNPAMTVGAQIAEAVRIHNRGLRKAAVHNRVLELMELVGIEHPGERFGLYPHQFSGGMLQRCVLAMALAGEPKIILADEPTTALDVTIQAQILDLLDDIRRRQNTAVILVSHDLGVVARAADRVAVMYAGKIVEIGTAEEIFYDSRHPYTWGLLQALPAYAKGKKSLHVIPGMPPTLIDPPAGDAFACRNRYALAIDYEKEPPMFRVSDTHYAATWLLDSRAPQILRPVGGMP